MCSARFAHHRPGGTSSRGCGRGRNSMGQQGYLSLGGWLRHGHHAGASAGMDLSSAHEVPVLRAHQRSRTGSHPIVWVAPVCCGVVDGSCRSGSVALQGAGDTEGQGVEGQGERQQHQCPGIAGLHQAGGGAAPGRFDQQPAHQDCYSLARHAPHAREASKLCSGGMCVVYLMITSVLRCCESSLWGLVHYPGVNTGSRWRDARWPSQNRERATVQPRA